MINRFDIARFVDHNSNKIVIGLGMFVIFWAGLIFYLYGLGAINDFQKASQDNITINRALIMETVKDIDAREAEWERLKKTPTSPPDIFR